MNLHNLQPLPLDSWNDTKTTLHLFTQIVGKIKLALHPAKNHWWHVTYRLSAKGLTTGPIPYNGFVFQIEFDLLNHQLIITTSNNDVEQFDISDKSVQSFYTTLMTKLKELNIDCTVNPKPFDPSKVGSDIPFDQDTEHNTYDKKAVTQFWEILWAIYPIMQTFNSRFYGKVSPLHFFWHSFDYVLTLFSGRKGPATEGMDSVGSGAYSHEVISFGFWPGDKNLPEPAFYAYAYPESAELINEPVAPPQAAWVDIGTGHLAIYKYSDWLQADDRSAALLKFMESVYTAGAKVLDWDSALYN